MDACGGNLIEISELLVRTFKAGGKLLICGNGGSAADAQHIAAEFINRFRLDRSPLPAIALTTDSSILTSVSNDFSFEHVFSKQIIALGKPGDVLITITTSGDSLNIVSALETAHGQKIKTVLFTGKKKGRCHPLADLVIDVQSYDTPRIQEVHIFFAHLLCEQVENALFK
jgi:D-sedoheptulose 7-phosphate isomerase